MKDFHQLIKTVKSSDYLDDGTKVDVLIKILRNEENNEKFSEVIYDPDFTYYVNNEDEEIDRPVVYISKDKVHEVTTKSRDIVKSVAFEIGAEDYFFKCMKNKEFRMAKEVLLDPNVHGADVDIEDYYISKHYQQYPITESKNFLSKGFFDIEVDSIDIVGFAEPEKAECPVNAISYFNQENMTLYGFFLKNDNNPQIDELIKNKKSFVKRIKKKYHDRGYDIKVKLIWYEEDEELQLINDFTTAVHELNPDFLGAWNLTNFDVPYLINRVTNLNGNIYETFSHPDFYDYPRVDLYEDNFNQDFADKGSRFTTSDYTIWIDMLLLFANLRKTFGKRESYSLDAIAREEIGEKKHEFENPDTNIKNSPYMNYEEFIEYNLHDTMLLFMIEDQNKDFDMYYTVAAKTETRIFQALKKTICVKNLARRFYEQNGFIMSDNHNTDYSGLRGKEKESFRGAFVANPNLNLHLGMKVNGKPSMYLFEKVIDFDLTSLYPSIILAFNVDVTTQLGQIKSEFYNIPELFDDIVSQDNINIAHKYFHLPNVEEMNILLNERNENVS